MTPNKRGLFGAALNRVNVVKVVLVIANKLEIRLKKRNGNKQQRKSTNRNMAKK